MILDEVSWMNIRRFRALHEAGASYVEIAAEVGCDWRTVKKYLAVEPGDPQAAVPPRAPSRAGTQPRVIEPHVARIEDWLRTDLELKGSVIHERLVAEYGFTGSYQRVKMFLAEARPRVAAELDEGDENRLRGLHRRFEVVAGAQAQVDWGDEGGVLAHVGIGRVYSFHMTLSHSRDPFTCFTTSMDMATFWACHRAAFAHFGGVPGSIVYDRTKTVVKRHVAPGLAVPIHPEAAAFAAHYGFSIDVLAAYRPTGKGRVERQVLIVRQHVLAGRSFDSIAELDSAFGHWLPIRRAQTHRTHGQVISVRAEADRAALAPLPDYPYVVAERVLRRVGRDCLISFEASFYSVPARQVRAGQSVEVRAEHDTITIHAIGGGTQLASHARAGSRGRWVLDPQHWAGLPDGRSRATVIDFPTRDMPLACDGDVGDVGSPVSLPGRDVVVAVRPLSEYAAAAGAGR
jgi:transposase